MLPEPVFWSCCTHGVDYCHLLLLSLTTHGSGCRGTLSKSLGSHRCIPLILILETCLDFLYQLELY